MTSTLISRMARDVLTLYDIIYKFTNNGKEQAFIAKRWQIIPLDIKMLVEFSESLKTVITNSLVDKDTSYGIVNYNGSYVLVADVIHNKNNQYFIRIDGKDYSSMVSTMVVSSLNDYIKKELYNIRQYTHLL